MRLEKCENEFYWVAESKDDFRGWELLREEPFKVGVKRLHIRRFSSHGAECKLVYCQEDHLPEVHKGMCV